MSSSGRNAAPVVVFREYQAAPDYCARAIELLLKQPLRKKAAPESRPDDDVKESSGYVAAKNLTK
jgi:hypothetical protein